MKIIILCLCVLSIWLPKSIAEPKAAQPWLVVRSNETYYVADKTCQIMGGNLADIEDEATEEAVLQYINTTTDLEDSERRQWFWVGRNDIAHEGVFVTAHGTNSTNYGWCSLEPGGGLNQNCVQYSTGPQCLTDDPCLTQRYFLCADVTLLNE